MTGSSARRRILFSRETLLGLVAVLLLAAICVMLGFWQFGRYENRRDEAAVVHANYEAAPVALDQVIQDPKAPLSATDVWTPVTLHGSYCTDSECVLYVRNRQLSGVVGYWQLVPFQADDGTTLLVVRGWVPQEPDSSAPAQIAPVPDGELTITARLRTAEPVLDREPPPGQTHSVNPPQSAGLMGLPDQGLVTGAFGELAAEDPAAERPASLPSPDTSLGPHLSYAFQWWIFALFFPAALIYRTRQLFRELAEDEERELASGAEQPEDASAAPRPPHDHDEEAEQGSSTTAALPRPSRRSTEHRPRRAIHARRRGQDEEEEDALIDQQAP
ncbi:SURF1 family protein [Brachybacterium paraconglomeratum]|uniref:SURF1 family cytochrome oxidase biogenesis protein n=1 Tax=Brachybacterium paraconglomeratum TaxID=173362 RepID=UPI0031EEF66C